MVLSISPLPATLPFRPFVLNHSEAKATLASKVLRAVNPLSGLRQPEPLLGARPLDYHAPFFPDQPEGFTGT